MEDDAAVFRHRLPPCRGQRLDAGQLALDQEAVGTESPGESEEQLGYLMVFSAGVRGSYMYYGKQGEMPYYCGEKTR